MLTYNQDKRLFIWRGTFETRYAAKDAGFEWSKVGKCWYTASPYIAYLLYPSADSLAKNALSQIRANIELSAADVPIVPLNNGLYPFQSAGVEYLTGQMRAGRRYLLLADEQGLGKTPEAVCLANNMGFKKLLVICPASLRLNWVNEISHWHKLNLGVEAVLTGKQKINNDISLVTSYNLMPKLKKYSPDFIIIDEAHYVKNMNAERTKTLLGDGKEKIGLIRKAPTLFLTGTPLPNGKPSELWPLLFRCAPEIINHARYWPFVNRFCQTEDDGMGGAIIRGAKRQKELFVRLRGSGFMLRRKKDKVLKDLPPKRYKMVVFPADSKTAKVLEKEKQFSANEIITHGIPVDGALPEIRREMGVAKVPQCLSYIYDLLHGGVKKVVIFAHHIEVVGLLERGLKDYGVVVITGSTKALTRQEAVDKFQSDSNVRVFIGNSAAQEGITLTAASDCVMVEPDWVPGNNDQRADRLHRIGQKSSVLVHLLVVQESLDANILSSAAYKSGDIGKILDEEKRGSAK